MTNFRKLLGGIVAGGVAAASAKFGIDFSGITEPLVEVLAVAGSALLSGLVMTLIPSNK